MRPQRAMGQRRAWPSLSAAAAEARVRRFPSGKPTFQIGGDEAGRPESAALPVLRSTGPECEVQPHQALLRPTRIDCSEHLSQIRAADPIGSAGPEAAGTDRTWHQVRSVKTERVRVGQDLSETKRCR